MRRTRKGWPRIPTTVTEFQLLVLLAGTTLVCIYAMTLLAGDKPPATKILRKPAADDRQIKKNKYAANTIDNPLIILLTQFRTGSTVVGEIFNQNQDMFYLFEPLSILKCEQRNHVPNLNENTVSKILGRLSRCEFSAESAACIGNTTVGVARSKNVGKVCRIVTGVAGVKCPLAHPGIYRNECVKSGKKAVAVTVTQATIKDLQDVVLRAKSDVKIIHLVRDPRATANSRRLFLLGSDEKRYVEQAKVKHPRDLPIRSLEDMGLFESTLKFGKARLGDMCLRMRTNLHTAVRQPKWLRGRYKLLRYEDFISDPLVVTEDIYSFIGHPQVPLSAFQWLVESAEYTETRAADNTVQTSERFGDSFLPPIKNQLSSAVKAGTASWRKYSKWEDVNAIQSMCDDVMMTLGYNFLRNEDEIWDYNVSVVSDSHLEI